MDNGEVIQGLDQEWTLGGAKLFEWIAGFTMMLVLGSLVFTPVARYGPHLAIICVGTALGLAALRRMFPDEERGMRNAVMTAIGIAPPGIPTPAPLQPYWSGMPLKELAPNSEYMQLGLHEIFEGEDDLMNLEMDPGMISIKGHGKKGHHPTK